MSFASTTFNVSPNAGDNGSSVLPIGSIINFGGSTAPTSWLLCDGTAVSRNTYTSLFGVIGTTYGAGDGTAVFITSGVSSGGATTYTLTMPSNNTNIAVGTPFIIAGSGQASFDGNTFTAIAPTNTTTITFASSTLTSITSTTYVRKATATTFNLPNTAGRMVRGVGTASWTGLGGGTADTTVVALGGTGGADGTKVSATNLPLHDHGIGIGGQTATNEGVLAYDSSGYGGATVSATGNYLPRSAPSGVNKTAASSTYLNNSTTAVSNSNAPTLNAYVGINYIIKYS